MVLIEHWFPIVMFSSSALGFTLLGISIYFMLFVPLKIDRISKLSLHGHEISSGLIQLFLSIAVIPTVTLPCIGVHIDGLFGHFKVMSPQNMVWSLLVLAIVEGYFVTFISLIRAFAVSISMSEKNKKIILFFHFAHTVFHILIFLYMAVILQNAGEEGLNHCRIIDESVANTIHIYSESLVYFFPMRHYVIVLLAFDAIYLAMVLGGIALTCGVVLIRSLRNHTKISMSYKHSKNQRNLTAAVLYLITADVLGLAVPCAFIALNCMLKVGSPVPAQIATIFISIYPLVGCSCIWMGNPAYKDKMRKLARKLRFRREHCDVITSSVLGTLRI